MRTTLARFFLAGTLTTLPAAIQTVELQKPSPGQQVKFSGVFQPVVTGASANSVRCPEASHPTLFTFRGEAFTTLGRATFEQSHCEGADHTSFRRGEQTITFANGDTLVGAYSGRLLPTATTAVDGRLMVDGEYRNLGGTGRFEGARGRGTTAGVVDSATGSATITVTGTL